MILDEVYHIGLLINGVLMIVCAGLIGSVHTTARYAFLGKPGTGKTTLARALSEEEILMKDGIEPAIKQLHSPLLNIYPDGWITGIWSNTPFFLQHDLKECDNHTLYSRNSKLNKCLLHPLWHPIYYLRQFDRAHNGICYLDEISKAVPARKVGRHSTELYNAIQEVVTNMRRHNNYLLYSDQWRRGADIMIRTTVDRVFMPILSKDIVKNGGTAPIPYLTFQPKTTEFWEMENPADLVSGATTMKARDVFPLFRTQEVVELTYNPPFKVEKWGNGFLRWCNNHGYILLGMKDTVVRNVIDLYQIKKNQFISPKEQSAILGWLRLNGKIGEVHKVG